MNTWDVAVIGAGVVGCAIARELARYELEVVVLERANDVGTGTSKANTAILHSGFDTPPGSVEAGLVRRGHDLLAEYAAQTGIALERTGATLVARDDEQASQLDVILEKSRLNGYLRARRIPVGELYQLEPHLGPGATGAVVIPDEWVICPWSTTLAYALEAIDVGVRFRFHTEVTAATSTDDGWGLDTTTGPTAARWVVNAAGLGSDVVDRLFGHDRFSITPRRGQLIVFDKLARPLVSSIILPVPTERTKGVLVAPTVYGNVLLGPTAEDLTDRRDTGSTAEGLTGLLDAGHRILPELAGEEVTAVYAGLRAATEHRDYQLRVHPAERYACAAGIRSTGLTASMAIAEHLVAQLGDGGLELKLRDRPSRLPRMARLGEADLRPYQDGELIAADTSYGRVVCFCERVSEGELRDALGGPLPATDLGGLRRRTRATNGRCQGFYCGSQVAAILEGAHR